MTSPPPGADGPRSGAGGRRSRFWRRVGAGLIVVVVLAVAAVGATYGYARYRYDQIHKVNIGARLGGPAPAGTMNILLVGNNCRACLNGKQVNAFGSGLQVGGGRSDVTMVLHLDRTTGRASLLSIPRDLFLPVPGTDRANRIDAALNSGPKALVQEIEDDLGIPIDHYVSVNFDSFQNIINDLGGVSMYFPDPVKDAYSALNITTPGCQLLNGFQALAVVRARHLEYYQGGEWHYDGLGDLSRIQRDHVFLQVLTAEVEHQLTNPLKLNAVVGTLAPQLQVDSGLSLGTMVSLARQFRTVSATSVPTYTLPVVVDASTYYYRGADYGDVVFPDYPADARTISQFLGPGAAPTAAAPAQTTVAVLNGTGAYNQATDTAHALSALGYQLAGVGDTTSVGSPAETTVYYAPGHQAAALALAGRMSGLVAVGPQPATGPTASQPAGSSTTDTTPGPAPGADLTVVTGTDFTVNQPGAAPSGAPSTSTTTTTVDPNLGAPTPPQQAPPNFDPTACPGT